MQFDLGRWVAQCVGLLDVLGVDRGSVIGNSFGGAVGLRLALDHPERVDRLVLMGASATPFPITEGLEAVWGYQPSRESMGHLLRNVFVYDGSVISDDLIDMRSRRVCDLVSRSVSPHSNDRGWLGPVPDGGEGRLDGFLGLPQLIGRVRAERSLNAR